MNRETELRSAVLLHAAEAGLRGTPSGEMAAGAVARVARVLSCSSAVLYNLAENGAAVGVAAKVGSNALPAIDPLVRIAAGAVDTQPCERTSRSRSDLAIAVRSGARTFAVLAVSRPSPGGFSRSDRRFVRRLALLLAHARRAERREMQARSLFARSRHVFENSTTPMMLVDAGTLRYVDVNAAAVEAYGYTREQWLTMTPRDLRAPGDPGLDAMLRALAADGKSNAAAVHRKADGSALDAQLSVVTLEREDGKLHFVTVQDMTERNAALERSRRSEATLERAQRELEHSAVHDRLTGLPNRVLLHDRLTAAIERARAKGTMAAVLFIDVDHFKSVNDSLGHAAGDVLLKSVADRLRTNTRQVDCIARMGGDEFIGVLGDIAEAEHVAAIVRHLSTVTAEPVQIGDRSVTTTASIGIALFPRDGDDAETLIRNADTAMYEAKRSGRATARFFSAAMLEAAEERTRLELRLRRAVDEDGFSLVYQPVHDFDGTLTGSEALIRWPQIDGIVAPNAFIPFAEESGLIVPIGAWVLRTACRQNAAWNRDGRALRISVNVSAHQIADPTFVGTVRSALHESGLPAHLLELELTETVMGKNIERNGAVVDELRAMGVRIAIDDFGTGYNSLATLRAYRVDTLKLDMCFVTDVAANDVDRAIASAVVSAAHGLGATVVAEGIETAQQRDTLRALGCDFGQGYLFAQPMSPERFGDLAASSMRTFRAA